VVSTPLKNMLVSWDYYSQYMESHKSVPNHHPEYLYIYMDIYIWRFPEIGVPPKIIYLNGIFHSEPSKNQAAGTPPTRPETLSNGPAMAAWVWLAARPSRSKGASNAATRQVRCIWNHPRCVYHPQKFGQFKLGTVRNHGQHPDVPLEIGANHQKIEEWLCN